MVVTTYRMTLIDAFGAEIAHMQWQEAEIEPGHDMLTAVFGVGGNDKVTALLQTQNPNAPFRVEIDKVK